nr:DUF3488 and transglutaminase-like domain-containing protein [Coralloluteibacterium stylophorae]
MDPAARRWSLVAAGACALPLLRLLPPALAAVLAGVGLLGAVSAFRRPWPSWLRLVMTLALAAAVLFAFDFRFGRDTGCALLMAMLMLKCGETAHLRDGRSLVGFGLFAAFAAFLQDQGPITLVLAAPAALLALAASQRLAESEAGLEAPPRVGPRLRQALLAVAIALPLALAAFWLFPRLPSPLWGVPENALAKTGIDDRMSPGEWIDLLADDSPAFRVRFFGAPPPSGQMYWRGPVLWQFDGRTWTRWDGMSYLEPPQVDYADAAVRYEITQEPTERRFMFALDLPESVPEGARLGVDLSPIAARPIRSLTRYTLESAPPVRFEPELRRATRDMALRLPAEFNPRTVAMARAWREEGLDDAAIVRRALEMYRRDFSYTLAAPPLGRDSVDEFLFDTRAGFCEHYSSSFAVLMRAAGIPTRVVTGYVGGYRNPFGDYWLVRQSEAHAWNEVWLAGRGWTRVDPTAAVAPERILNTVNDLGDGGGGGGMRPMLDIGDWLRRGWNDLVLGFDAARQSLLLQPFGIERASGWQVGLAFAAVAGLILLASLLLMLRERAPPGDPVLVAWRRFTRRFARTPVPKPAHEPALAWAWRAAEALPADAARIRSLTARFVAARYAPAQSEAGTDAALVRDLRRFRLSSRP